MGMMLETIGGPRTVRPIPSVRGTAACRFVPVVLALISGVKASAADQGPRNPDGQLAYENFTQFQRDMEIACYAVELSGADKTPRDEQADYFSKWLAAQQLGPDFKRVWEAVALVEGANKARLFLAAASEANIARCPYGEETFRTAVMELRGRCSQGEDVACQHLPELLNDVDDLTQRLARDASAECKKGRTVQCSLPRQYEQMKNDLRAGAPPPKAPRHLHRTRKARPDAGAN